MRFVIFALFYFFGFIVPVSAETELNQETLNNVLQQPVYTNLSRLTHHLTASYQNDYDKARAIAYYIASHIAYDEYLYSDNKKTKLQYKKRGAQEILQSKVGICSDFALLFATMCQMAGIRAYIVRGNIFDVDDHMRVLKNRKNIRQHAWNYFEYQRRKVLVDTTFMAGGKTGHESYVTDLKHRRAINNIKKQNQTYSVNPFYFDFDEKEEKQLRHISRSVKNTR